MAKKKIRRPRYEISEKQLKKIKYETANDATQKACLLCIAAMADTLNLNEDQICEVAEDITKWACFLDDHIVKIGEIADVIKKKTGSEFSKFKRN